MSETNGELVGEAMAARSKQHRNGVPFDPWYLDYLEKILAQVVRALDGTDANGVLTGLHDDLAAFLYTMDEGDRGSWHLAPTEPPGEAA